MTNVKYHNGCEVFVDATDAKNLQMYDFIEMFELPNPKMSKLITLLISLYK